MIPRPHVDWFALAPIIALLAAAMIALLAAVLVRPRGRRTFAAVASALGYAVALGFAIALYARTGHGHPVIAGSMQRDRCGEFAQMIVAATGILAVGVSVRERMTEEHVAEY